MESYEETLKRARIGDLLELLEDQAAIEYTPLIHAAIKTYVYLKKAQESGYKVCLTDAAGNVTAEVAIPSDGGVIDRFVG